MENGNVIYGKGEYALTMERVPKLTADVMTFTTTGVWKWALVDVLGIRKDGTVATRYDAILKTLDAVGGEKCEGLALAMRSVGNRVAAIVHPTARTAAVVKTEKTISPKLAAKLMEMLSEEELAELVK